MEPLAYRLGRDAVPRAARNLVLAGHFQAELRVQGLVAGGRCDELGEESVAKQQRSLVVGVGGIGNWT